jgi:flagellar biogenesis protein FliO
MDCFEERQEGFPVRPMIQIACAARDCSTAFRAWAIDLWQRGRSLKREPRRLRLCESLPLGERRFVAVVEFDGERFLVGGTSSSLVLLSRLGEARPETHSESEQNVSWKAPAMTIRNGMIEIC